MTEKEQTPMTEKESVRWRVANAHIDPDNYVFIPAKKQNDYYDNDVPQRVAIYVRVSTDSSKQTIPGTEDLKPYIPAKVMVGKWISTIVLNPLIAAIVAGIMLLF